MPETTVYVDRLRIRAYHGVLPEERVVGNDFVVSLRVACPWAKAGESDELADTVSYAALADIIGREMAVPAKLVEHVAWRIVKAVKREHPSVTAVSIDIKKVAPPIAWNTEGCGVTLQEVF